jgi:TolB protein
MERRAQLKNGTLTEICNNRKIRVYTRRDEDYFMQRLTRLLVAFSIGSVLSISAHRGSAQSERTPTLPPLPGHIAYIGADLNVYTVVRDTNTIFQLTTDAVIERDSALIYQWPTWSTDGRLAYFQTLLTRAGTGTTAVYIASDAETPGISRYETADKSFTYAYWSPQNCDADSSCRELAVLMGTPSGFNVDVVRDIQQSEAEVSTIGQGSPFYFSWSPDGERMLWHRNQAGIEVHDRSEGQVVSAVSQPPGAFAAPAWSPVDDRLLYGRGGADSATTDLVIATGDDLETIVSGLRGPVYFSWSPNGNHIAYVDRQGALIVIDAVSGERLARTSVTGVLAFFWSPNSERIAYLTLANTPGSFNAFDSKSELLKNLAQGQAVGLVWSVFDISTEETQRYGAFVPTREMIYLLSFYDQFAQSHRLWSPNSTHLVYGEVTTDGQSFVSILDTTRAVSVPLNIADGVIGIWSFN